MPKCNYDLASLANCDALIESGELTYPQTQSSSRPSRSPPFFAISMAPHRHSPPASAEPTRVVRAQARPTQRAGMVWRAWCGKKASFRVRCGKSSQAHHFQGVLAVCTQSYPIAPSPPAYMDTQHRLTIHEWCIAWTRLEAAAGLISVALTEDSTGHAVHVKVVCRHHSH